jgi:putative transposase
VFGARYKRSLIQSDIYFYHAYKYLYRNPLEALISSKIEDYKYSTFQGILNKQKIAFPVHDLNVFPNDHIPKDITKRLQWINDPYSIKEKQLIKNALKRPIFELPSGKNVIATVNKLLKIPKR